MESNYYYKQDPASKFQKSTFANQSTTCKYHEEKVRCYQHPKLKLGCCPNQCILFCMMVQASGGCVAC